jgi:hypothetical protein
VWQIPAALISTSTRQPAVIDVDLIDFESPAPSAIAAGHFISFEMHGRRANPAAK